MQKVSIIFAYRNRDIERIRICMDSLSAQICDEFEVLFVDYGSEPKYSNQLKKLFTSFKFVKYYYLDTKQQLWNKSKALNFGIKNANFDNIFIADVDLIFSPAAVGHFINIISPNIFFQFKMGYLTREESFKLGENYEFKDLRPQRFGDVNGMILAPRELFFKVKGYDEFFHFYGSEDVDLYARLNNAGYTSKFVNTVLFNHNWHVSYEIADRTKFNSSPRLRNARRINEQHYFYHKRKTITIPNSQEFWGEIRAKDGLEILKKPTIKIQLKNILAEVEHFFWIELPNIKKGVVEINVVNDPFYNSWKHKLKKLFKKQSQIYCSLQDVNDLILKMIIVKYRNSNYSYEIAKDLNSLKFVIQK